MKKTTYKNLYKYPHMAKSFDSAKNKCLPEHVSIYDKKQSWRLCEKCGKSFLKTPSAIERPGYIK